MRWTTYDRCRDDDEGEDDLIEVEMEELQAPEGNWDGIVASEESFCYCVYLIAVESNPMNMAMRMKIAVEYDVQDNVGPRMRS